MTRHDNKIVFVQKLCFASLLVLFVTSADEQRENPTAVMDALQMCDRKLHEPTGQKYMGARSTEDLTADPDSTKEQMADANGLPVLPQKSKEMDESKRMQKPVCADCSRCN